MGKCKCSGKSSTKTTKTPKKSGNKFCGGGKLK